MEWFLYIRIIVACCPHLVRSIDTSQLTEACSHIVTQPFSVLFPGNSIKYLQKFTLAKHSFLLPFVSWESRWPEIPVGKKYSHASCLSSFIRMEFDLGREYFFFLLLERCFIYILWYTWWKLCSAFSFHVRLTTAPLPPIHSNISLEFLVNSLPCISAFS